MNSARVQNISKVLSWNGCFLYVSLFFWSDKLITLLNSSLLNAFNLIGYFIIFSLINQLSYYATTVWANLNIKDEAKLLHSRTTIVKAYEWYSIFKK